MHSARSARARAAGLIIAALLLLLCRQPSAQVAEAVATVVNVADGDTLTVLDEHNRRDKVRLNGIDAPETGQDFGNVSRRSLSDLVLGRSVTLVGNKRDRYGRLIATVLLKDGRDVNLAQVEAGLAWYFRQYAADLPASNRARYDQAETNAKAARRGLWAQGTPIPPWEFRRPTSPPSGPIIGNANSQIYHLPSCPDYRKVSPQNQRPFETEAEAAKAGYRKARNCP